jgi:hypothetical protein
MASHEGAATPEALAAMRSGEAWESLCDSIKQMGATVLSSEFAGDDLERAEGYRYLLGFLSLNLTRSLYSCGPELPFFLRAGNDDVVKFALDNPDGINSKSAQLREDLTYRLYGKAGGERYVEFVQNGPKGTLTNHYLDQFEIGPDGDFEIFLSKEPHEGNWIPLAPGVRSLLVRHVQYDWENEPMTEMLIERPGVSGIPDCLRTPDPAEVGAQVLALGKSLSNGIDYWLSYVRSFRVEGDNVIPKHQPLAASGVSAVRAAPKGFFVLAPDEAMLLEFEPPQGSFWSVCLGDVWFRSFDPSHLHTSLNGHYAKVDADGKCRVIIAHSDPGVANWLDTAGHGRGIVTFRFVRTDTRPIPEMVVIPHADISSRLPPDTTRVNPEERAAIIASRARGYSRRFADPMTSRWSRR